MIIIKMKTEIKENDSIHKIIDYMSQRIVVNA